MAATEYFKGISTKNALIFSFVHYVLIAQASYFWMATNTTVAEVALLLFSNIPANRPPLTEQ